MANTQTSMTHPSSSVEYILEILKNHGFRKTTQRVSLIEVLDRTKVSLSVKDVFAKLKKQKIKIDEASVYRIIEKLKELNIVHIYASGKIKLCHHLACEQKFHLSYECEQCGKVLEPHLDSKQENEIAKTLKLELTSIRQLHVGYVCSACAV